MKKLITTMLSLAMMGLFSIGCGPRPIVEERVQEQPAVDVDVKPDTTDDNAGVGVQVGGEEGVQVETERSE